MRRPAAASFQGERGLAAIKGDSRIKLLDAAEELFARKGYDATTTREIAAKSGDTLGTLNYHFGSKRNLLERILQRRFVVVAEGRERYYRDALAEGTDGRPSLDGVVRAIALPYFDLALSGEPGWRHYVALLSRIREAGDDDLQRFYFNFAEPNMRQGMAWLGEAAPAASARALAYCYEFATMLALGTCTDIARDRLHKLSGDPASGADAHRHGLLSFVLNGVRAVLDQDLHRAPAVKAALG